MLKDPDICSLASFTNTNGQQVKNMIANFFSALRNTVVSVAVHFVQVFGPEFSAWRRVKITSANYKLKSNPSFYYSVQSSTNNFKNLLIINNPIDHGR